MVKTSSLTDSSSSTAQNVIEYDEVDVGGGGGKLVKKLSKSPKSLKGLKNLQRPLVWRNIYQSTNPPSIRYKELEFPLEFWQFFKLFLLGPKSS